MPSSFEFDAYFLSRRPNASYSYNDAGFIAEISEINSSFKVQLLYDELNREVIRKYSNGVQVRKGYNEYGQKIFT